MVRADAVITQYDLTRSVRVCEGRNICTDQKENTLSELKISIRARRCNECSPSAFDLSFRSSQVTR